MGERSALRKLIKCKFEKASWGFVIRVAFPDLSISENKCILNVVGDEGWQVVGKVDLSRLAE
jgi:hypothetical protein